jgi:hypothetical protein
MLQLLARNPLFNRKDLKQSSRGRGSAPPGPPPLILIEFISP